MTALCISVVSAAAKLFAVLETGSSALLVSTVHSLIDVSCLGLLLLGLWNASAAPMTTDRAPDRALYFWSFVVAIVLYAMGGGIALHEGAERLARPQQLVPPPAGMLMPTVVLALAAAGGALVAVMAMRALRSARTSSHPVEAGVHRPDLAPAIAVLVIAAAAIAGNVLAWGGLLGAANGGDRLSDPFAAIAVGLAMTAVAAFMAIEVKRVLCDLHAAAGTTHSSPPAVQPLGDVDFPRVADAPPVLEIKSMPASEPPAAAAAAAAAEEPRAAGAGGAAQKPSVSARQNSRKGRGKRRR